MTKSGGYILRELPYLACIFFVFAGLWFIPLPGIQNDEAIFAMPIYYPESFSPGMVMSYSGELKTWIYYPFLREGGGPYRLRIPVLLIGALTIWLFYRFVHRAHGERAAVVACLLLATDSIFLLTTCFDWGPVALQHFLLMLAMLLIFRFVQTRSLLSLALGSLAIGLGIWDKVSFIWLVVGLGAASLLVFPRETWRSLTRKSVPVFVVMILLGCLPLLVYNARATTNTVKQNVTVSLGEFAGKTTILRRTLDGSGLFGYLVPDPAGKDFLPRTNLTWVAVGAAFVMIPLFWRTRSRKILLFALVFVATTWIQMAIVKGAGGAVHHAVLLLPFPQLAVAVVLTELPRRMGGAIALLLIVSNLLVTSHYFEQFARFGAVGSWTDAIYELDRDLRSYPDAEKQVVDWGMFNSLALMNGRDPSLHVASEEILKSDQGAVATLVKDPRNVFIGHVAAEEQFRGIGGKLESMAAVAGYRKRLMQVTKDRQGRDVFEIYRFETGTKTEK